jgi:hypothetical protein
MKSGRISFPNLKNSQNKNDKSLIYEPMCMKGISMMVIMIYIRLILIFMVFAIIGCSENQRPDVKESDNYSGEVDILKTWQGDFPVDQLQLLPDDQQNYAMGYIIDNSTFAKIWEAYKPSQTTPDINFEENLVLFARNIQFYNRISIGKVNLKDGVAEVLAMETMSALPIENNVAFSIAVVPKRGIKAIKVGENVVSLP